MNAQRNIHHAPLSWPPSLGAVLALVREGLGVVAALVLAWVVYYGAAVAMPSLLNDRDSRTQQAIDRLDAQADRRHQEAMRVLEDIRFELRHAAGKKVP